MAAEFCICVLASSCAFLATSETSSAILFTCCDECVIASTISLNPSCILAMDESIESLFLYVICPDRSPLAILETIYEAI